MGSSDSDSESRSRSSSNPSSPSESSQEDLHNKPSKWDKIIRKPTKGTAGLDTTKYLKAIEDEPKNPKVWLNFAVYLAGKKDYDRAERYFRRSLAIDSSYALGWSAYGLFLEEVRNALDKAEEMYKKSVELANENKNFTHASVYSNYAVFLKRVRQNMPVAEEYYKKACLIDPYHPNTLGNYGLFLLTERRDVEMADKYLARAARAVRSNKHVKWMKIYAQFLRKYLQDKRTSETWYRKAAALK